MKGLWGREGWQRLGWALPWRTPPSTTGPEKSRVLGLQQQRTLDLSHVFKLPWTQLLHWLIFVHGLLFLRLLGIPGLAVGPGHSAQHFGAVILSSGSECRNFVLPQFLLGHDYWRVGASSCSILSSLGRAWRSTWASSPTQLLPPATFCAFLKRSVGIRV